MAGFEVTRNLGQIMENVARASKKAAQRRGDIIAEEAVLKAAELADEELKTNRGSYSRGFYVIPTAQVGGRSVRLTVGNRSGIGALIEHGAPPHPIAPVNVSRLKWPEERSNTGGPVVLRPGQVVSHPGFEGKHIIRRAMNYALQRQRGFGRGGR